MATLNELVLRARTVYQKTSAVYFRTGIFVSLLGLMFAIPGSLALASSSHGEWGYFPLITGVLFIAWGISNFVAGKRMAQK